MSTGTPYSTPEELISALYSTSSTLPGPFQEINESFLLDSAYLVFFMHCGFAMVSHSDMLTRSAASRTQPGTPILQPRYPDFPFFLQLSIGCVRAKFAKHIAILILVDATASALGFYLFGFAFAYGDDASADGLSPAGNAFIGKNFFAMDNMAPTAYYNWVFQWTVSHVQLLFRPTLSLSAQAVQNVLKSVQALSCPHVRTRSKPYAYC